MQYCSGNYSRISLVFPTSIDIVTAVYELFNSTDFVHHFVQTAKAVVVATGLAIVSGIALGTLIGYNEFVTEAIEPLLYYFSSILKTVSAPVDSVRCRT